MFHLRHDSDAIDDLKKMKTTKEIKKKKRSPWIVDFVYNEWKWYNNDI